jgi:Domain of unknown function (DUF4326)
MRKIEVEAGRSVLASLRNKNGVPVDNALIEWAESQNLAVRIDRSSVWRNPYRLGTDGTRKQVIKRYREDFARHRSLHKRIGELKGKVLICWCYPEYCHGEILADAATQIAGAANLSVPAGIFSPGAGDGFYVLLDPLKKGKHTLHFNAEMPAGKLNQDGTYNLTVLPVSLTE